MLPSRFLDEPPLRGGINKCSFTMRATAIKSLVSLFDSSLDDDMSTLLKYASDTALRLLLPIYKDSKNRGQCPRHRQLRWKLRRPMNITAWANGRTGCGQRAAMFPEHLSYTLLLTAGASGAAG
jgi:hypothetical protein